MTRNDEKFDRTLVVLLVALVIVVALIYGG